MIEYLDTLAQLPSTNDKRDFLEKTVKDDPSFVEFIKLFAEKMNFFVRSVNLPAPHSFGDDSVSVMITRLRDFYSKRRGIKQEEYQNLANCIAMSGESVYLAMLRLIDNDLKCGVGKTLIRQVLGLTKDPRKGDVLLATKMSDKALAKIKYPAIAQLKSDGMRVHIVVNKDSIFAISRNGKNVDCINTAIREDLKHILSKIGDEFVLDGELLWEDDNGCADRKTGNGIGNKAVRGTISDAERAGFYIVAWDIIKTADLEESGKNLTVDIPYSERLNTLMSLIKSRCSIRLVPSKVVHSLDEAVNVYEKLRAKGHEGAILKNMDSSWVSKRSPDLVKMKAEETADLLVVGWTEGTGKFEGMIGSFECTDASGKLEVSVGTGMDEGFRKSNPDDVVGKIIEVKYNAVITDKKKKDRLSLFLPVFERVRLDKDEPDLIEESD